MQSIITFETACVHGRWVDWLESCICISSLVAVATRPAVAFPSTQILLRNRSLLYYKSIIVVIVIHPPPSIQTAVASQRKKIKEKQVGADSDGEREIDRTGARLSSYGID